MARIGAARVIPVHNPQATKPEDAYKINAMFPQQLMTALNVGQLLHAAEKPADLQVTRNAVVCIALSLPTAWLACIWPEKQRCMPACYRMFEL